jgi:hypothetical protein
MYPMILRVWGVEKPVRACREISVSTFGGSEGISRIIFLGYIFHRGNFGLLINNILKNGHKNILFLTLVPHKIFFIIIITKTLELVFNHFCPSKFLDLERSGMRGRIGRFRERGIK